MPPFSEEFNQIFQNCRDKHYIIRNARYLKTFFDVPENQEHLAVSLTTLNSPVALKLLDILELDLTPRLVINRHAYTSFYWLYRQGRISSERFEQVKRQFKMMDNSEQVFEEAEKEYVKQQMESKRRVYNQERTPESIHSITELNFLMEKNLVFVANIDDFVDILDLAVACPKKILNAFSVDDSWRSLSSIEGETCRSEKQMSLLQISKFCSKNTRVPVRFVMKEDKRVRMDELCSIMRKLDENRIDFYIASEHPLSKVSAVIYAYYNGYFQFFRIIRMDNGQRIEIEGKRVLHFGKGGDIPWEYFGMSVNNYLAGMEREILIPEYSNEA